MKEELRKELKGRMDRERTMEGTAARATATIKRIYTALVNIEPDGELLAVRFRNASNNQSMIAALSKAMKNGTFREKARELLSEVPAQSSDPKAAETEIYLKRICWCWIQPSGKRQTGSKEEGLRVTGQVKFGKRGFEKQTTVE